MSKYTINTILLITYSDVPPQFSSFLINFLEKFDYPERYIRVISSTTDILTIESFKKLSSDYRDYVHSTS